MGKRIFIDQKWMPMKLGLRFLLFILILSGAVSQKSYGVEKPVVEGVAQTPLKISGVVKDSNGEPVIGANVIVLGATQGAITDVDGKFTLEIAKYGVKIKVSFIGYKEKIVTVGKGIRLDIVLEEDSQLLNEVEVVAYGSQKKVSVTGAISSMRGEDLLKAPSGSLSNVLAGKLPGVTSVQYSGEPGADDAELYVRGITTLNSSAPLIQVDGVEREFSQIDPNEIESITVLKDASATAVFGVRGANGVILITTKRGTEGKAKVSISTSVGVQMLTKQLEFANSYQTAIYYNEAQKNSGVPPENYKFQPEVLEAFRTHSDPLLYPDIDWMDYIMKRSAIQSQHNVNISGGVDRVRYFVSMGIYTQDGLFKEFGTEYDSNFSYKRYNYRANLDFDLTKSTVLSANVSGRIENKNRPNGQNDSEIFRTIYWATPFGGAGIVDGKRILTNGEYLDRPGIDALKSYYGLGYNVKTTNVLTIDLSLNQKLDFITKGLSFRLKGAYNSSYDVTKRRTCSIPSYTPKIDDVTGEMNLMKSGDEGELGYGESFGKGRNWYMDASLNYTRSFNNHNVGAMLLYNQSKTYYPKAYTDIPSGYVGLVGRVTYDWKTRYMFEFNVGYNGSENFAPERRYGVFPAGSVGWIISEENFMKPLKNVVNYLKVRASYGLVGNDKYYVNGVQQRFMYIPDSYALGGGYNFGINTGSNQPGASEKTKSNPDVGWEKAYKQNYGLDASFLDDRLKLTVDVFREHREDILVMPAVYPGTIAMSLPVMNNGVVDSKGYELSLQWNAKLNDNFRYWINANFSHAENVVVEKNEVPKNEPYMMETGHPVGQPFGRKFWGFYDETAEERYEAEFGKPIAEHVKELKPGDCIFLDLNDDGVIDGDDVTAIGYTNNPEYISGATLGFSWKNFDFSMQWNAAWKVSRMLQETFLEPLGDTGEKGLLLYQFENRWTEETAATATLPRAAFRGETENLVRSDLNVVDASYIRLKNMEIGYNCKFPFLKKIGINNCRIYMNGYNLLTFTGFQYGDPESRTSDRPQYPLNRVFNLGLKIGF